MKTFERIFGVHNAFRCRASLAPPLVLGVNGGEFDGMSNVWSTLSQRSWGVVYKGRTRHEGMGLFAQPLTWLKRSVRLKEAPPQYSTH